MAPRTRSSIHVRPPSHDASDTQATEDQDMESDHEMTSSEMGDMLNEDVSQTSAATLQSTAQELLRPLQETADRVSRQMEEFATALDQFNANRKSNIHDQELWKHTWLLMDQYSIIAQDRADQVRSRSSSKTTKHKNSKSLGDTASQEQNLMLEADLWTLNATLLPCKSPDMVQDTTTRQNTALADLHQYSTPTEIFNAFLDVDAIAMQYELILEWLQEWKRKTAPQITDRLLDSYSQAQRGEGLWTNGNIYTMGPIKRQKVGRAHPKPLNPQDHGLSSTHLRQNDSEPLVTQMDPDAASRQSLVLELEDEINEESAWHICWELLRRGSSLEDARSWWKERNELWRSLTFRNTALQEPDHDNKAWSRIINIASNRGFADLCSQLGEDRVGSTPYEDAVRGVLGGNYSAAKPVCQSIDDHLFCLTNELFIERFEHFLDAYEGKIQNSSVRAFHPEKSSLVELSNYVKAAQADKSTKAESHQPHKYIQCALMSDDLVKYFIEMGHAAAQMAHLTGQSKALFDNDESQINECAQIAAQDEDVVRMTAHLQLALQPLGLLDQAGEHNASVLENNIVNYIGLLEQHSKFDLLPLYAAQISPDRQPRVLGRILAKVTSPKERDSLMRLMKEYQIAVNRVICTICDYSRRVWIMKLGDRSRQRKPAKVVEYRDKIVRVRSKFIGEQATEDETEVVQAHEWVNYIDTINWGMAVWLMATLYKTLLLQGRIAAARSLSEKVSLSATSLKVTGMNLGVPALLPDSMSDDGDAAVEDDEADEITKLASPTKRRREAKGHLLAKESTNRTTLTKQSIVWAHLEYLVTALDTLEVWQDLADEVDELPRNDVRTMKHVKKQLTEALQHVIHAMQPLLENDFLNFPNDEQEDRDLTAIRNHYLPECVLAYDSALYFAGHVISRQHLVHCMDLAQSVAQNQSLTQAFVNGKRMQELVTAFALDSQALLRANEVSGGSGRGRAGKRSSVGMDHHGRTDIWQVSWKRDDDKQSSRGEGARC